MALPIHYEIKYSNQNNPKLNVQLRFNGDVDGETEIALPNNFGSTQKLHRCIQKFTCTSKPQAILFDIDTLFVRIYHAPGQELTISYDIVQDFPIKSLNSTFALRPIIQEEYFHVLGNSLFLLPNGYKDYDVTVEWKSFPKPWKLHNSMGTQQTTQRFYANSSRWLESVFVGGDFKILESKVAGKPIYLAIRGSSWAFDHDVLLAMLQKTVETQRNFWGDFDIPYYSVTLIPLQQNIAGEFFGNKDIYYMGMGLSNSFAAFASPTKSLNVNSLFHLFNHEMMHDWIGYKIRNGGQSNDMQYAWFSEGFTEYFAYKNMYASGFINADEYVRILNEEFLSNYYQSDFASAPNSAIEKDFFNKEEINQLPYKRGCLLAFYLDNAIKFDTYNQHNLHDFMIEMLDHYYENDEALSDNFDFFVKNLDKYMKNRNISQFLKKHITDGNPIAPQLFVLPALWKITINEKGIPELALNKEILNWETELGK
jgi:predicted metalloprotease with PDZ domain